MTSKSEISDRLALDAFLKQVETARWPEEIWRSFLSYVRSCGVSMVSYHHLPPPGTQSGEKIRVVADGYPEGWTKDYILSKAYLKDPITNFSARSTEPFFWSDIDKLVTLSKQDRDYLDRGRAAGLRDGLAVQAYGPGGRNGYFGLGFTDANRQQVADAMRDLKWACQVAHQAYCGQLQFVLPDPPVLSERERDVLKWMARGKSNTVIAQILNLSPHTVDAYVRRIFQKFGTNDRVSAAVAAVGAGLIMSTE